MHLDLHLHSTCSDGSLAPDALVRAAARAGLHAIALTDHDTTAGVAAARATGRECGVLVVTGCELSCSLNGRDLHILGYGIDPDHPSLAAFTGRMLEMRRERIGVIVGRLRALGVAIEERDVVLPAGNAAAGRPHVAEALVRLGVVQTIQEAFSRFLSDAGPASVPARGPEARDGIDAINAAGGLAVWAHPSSDDLLHIPGMAAAGLAGVEAFRPLSPPHQTLALESAARESGLVVTGGSDWHGGLPALGTWYVTDRHVAGLLARLGIDRDGKEIA